VEWKYSKKEESFGDEKAHCLLYTNSFPLLFDVYADFELASQLG